MALTVDLQQRTARTSRRRTRAEGSFTGLTATAPRASAPSADRALLVGLDLVTISAIVAWAVLPAQSTHAVTSGVVIGGSFVLLTAAWGGYTISAVDLGRHMLAAAFRALALVTMISMGAGYLGLLDIPPHAMFEAVLLSGAAIIASRVTRGIVLRRMRSQGRALRRAVLLGQPDSLESVAERLRADHGHGLRIVGTCSPPQRADEVGTGTALAVRTTVEHLVERLGAQAVVACSASLGAEQLRRLSWELAGRDVELLVVPGLTEILPSRLRLTHAGGAPMMRVALDPSPPRRWAKQVLDRSLGLFLLLLASPLLLGAMLAVRLTSPGPAIFAQRRVTVDGTHFTMYKLRTMCQDAESRLTAITERNDGNGMLFKMHEDPRVTPLGRILRRLSIDELPQLWNVVIGDMSLVGPRPALPSEVAEYDEVARHRLVVRPGLTGLWQVSGRSDLSAEDSVRLDLHYADNWSMGMDLKILGLTCRAVLGGHGAY